ncbi:MAG: membrane integrity-associated transporter subunit PqiC [Deltaproteobacteria bacterium]|nr:membrane integrity-associated transporter subunit PqiC [Deltaproteobacteria bacterium]
MLRCNARTLALALVAACGCASPPSSFYALEPVASRGPAAPVPQAVIVGPVSIPASVDRPEFVVRIAENQVRVDELNRWVSPLSDAIARTVSTNLAALLGTPDVATAPLANFQPVYRVTVDVQRFDSAPGEAASLDAVWVVRRTAGGSARSGRTTVSEPAQGDGHGALAAAHSRAVATLSEDIAAAIRAEAASTP